MIPFEPRNRKEIRRSIGDILGKLYVGTATSDGTVSKITDTMLEGGHNEHNGKECIYCTGTNNAGLIRRVTGYDAEHNLFIQPDLTDASAEDDEYELWEKPVQIKQIHRWIDDALISLNDKGLQDYAYDDLIKEEDYYEYDIPSDFVGLHTIQYEGNIGVEETLHECNGAWDELTDGDVTVTEDDDFYKSGGSSVKVVVAAGCGAGDILTTDSISEIDISGCDKTGIWIWSSVALDTGDLQLLLDDTAQCASPVESLDIPATTANTWTYHTIDLDNPYSDSEIISVGIKMITDKGAFTLRVDKIRAWNSQSVKWEHLYPNCWELIHGSSPKIKLTPAGYSMIGDNRMMRLVGYKLPTLLSDDTTDCEVDPNYVENFVLSRAMIAYGKRDGTDHYEEKSDSFMRIANELKSGMGDSEMDTRWVRGN